MRWYHLYYKKKQPHTGHFCFLVFERLSDNLTCPGHVRAHTHAVCGAAMFAVFGRGLGGGALPLYFLTFFLRAQRAKESFPLSLSGRPAQTELERLGQPHSFDPDTNVTPGSALASLEDSSREMLNLGKEK